MADRTEDRPVLFAYDGSEHAKAAIRQAGRQLRSGRHAIVLTVWHPLATLPFATAAGLSSVGLDGNIEQEARSVAEEGAKLAQGIGLALLGSVATAAARHTERPVLIAHGGSQPGSASSH